MPAFNIFYVSLLTKQILKGKNSMMKKSILLFVFCLLCVISQAQTEHLKFAGIPITGNIEQFQQQLLAKGFKQNTINKFEIEELDGKLAPEGKRIYRGKFVNQKAKVKVFFDTKTKQVFRVQAYFTKLDENAAQVKLEYYKGLLANKYGAANMKEHDQSKELPGFLLTAHGGQIFGYVSKSSIFYNTYIQYTDSINEESHRHQMLNDL
jgi:hypothetical protein